MENVHENVIGKRDTNGTFEKILTILTALFAVSIFFSKSGLSVFGIAAILAMILWRFIPGYTKGAAIPNAVIILTILLLANIFVSSFFSINSKWALSEFGKYRHLLFGGLLYAAPLSRKNRKGCIIIFLISAAFDGLTGILQFFNLLYDSGTLWTRTYSAMRPLGNSSDPILYAANLALAFGASLVLFFIGKDIFKTQKERLLLCLSASVILMGILVSGSRGVWVALFPACVITLYFYNRRSALLLLSVFIVLAAITFTFSNTMKERASTIVTSLYTENETGSTGNRVELWKGALLMFKQSPFTGIGSGDFEVTIKKYIAEKKIRNIEAKGHAHSIYFQIVATRGLIGISIFIAFLVSLLLWGSREIKNGNQIGGYTIVMSTLLALLGGLTENHIEVHRYLAAFGFTIGLIGPYQRAG